MSTEARTPHGPAFDGGREGPGDATSQPGGGAGADQSAEPVWRYQVPPPGSGAGAGASQAGHYTPNPEGQGGGIVGAPADSNVNAPGRPLSGAGSATDPTGGTLGGIAASRKARETGEVAGGGNPVESAANADGNMSGSAGTDRS